MVLRLDIQPARSGANPIIALGGSGSFYEKQVFDPVVMVDPSDETKLVMWFTGMASPVMTGVMSIGRATATVADPTTWTVTGQVLTAGGWETSHVRLGDVKYNSGVYSMYYTGGTPGSGTGIGLATSADGISWTKENDNPILTAGGQGRDDGDHVSEPAVIKEGADWTMIYSYRNGGDVLPGYRYATSADGVSWTKEGDTLLSVPNLYHEWHQIIKIGNSYVLVFEAGSNTTTYRIYAASSSSPRSAFSLFPHPVLTESGVEGAFDRYHVATAYLLQLGSDWHLFYCGAQDHDQPYATNTWPLGVATFVERAHCHGGRR